MGYCNIYKIDTFNDVGKGFVTLNWLALTLNS